MAEEFDPALIFSAHSACFSSMSLEEDKEELRRRQELISTLPVDTRWPPLELRRYKGFWFMRDFLAGVLSMHDNFRPLPSDIILATHMKSGTTWQRALAGAILSRGGGAAAAHLSSRHAQECAAFLDGLYFFEGRLPDLCVIPSPRLLATHTPYSLLPDALKEDTSGARIVYMGREPKDTLVSMWHFFDGIWGEVEGRLSLREALEMFCEGVSSYGPVWEHQLEYWEASKRRPDKVLFLKYEDAMADPAGTARRLAGFMGRGFTEEEERDGAVEEIVEMCSFGKLSQLPVNSQGELGIIKSHLFFRKGKVGDWANHLTPEMAKKIDDITLTKFQGSGLSFSSTLSPTQ